MEKGKHWTLTGGPELQVVGAGIYLDTTVDLYIRLTPCLCWDEHKQNDRACRMFWLLEEKDVRITVLIPTNPPNPPHAYFSLETSSLSNWEKTTKQEEVNMYLSGLEQ